MTPPDPALSELTNTAASLLALLQSFAKALHPSNNDDPPPAPTPPNPPDALSLLQTAATLLKAQTTKLGLLLVNDPFTPSAVKTILSEMAAQSTPSLLAAAQLCTPATHGRTMRDEARARARRICVELGHLVQEVQGKTTAAQAGGRRDALASTGVVWAACDAGMALRGVGIAGLLAQRSGEARALLEDAGAELREWRDDADDEGFESDEEGDSAGAGAAGGADDAGASLEALLGAAHRLPSGRADLRALLDAALRRLRLAGTLCAAVGKRRFRGVADEGAAPTAAALQRADAAVRGLKRMPHLADEMAGRFYELDADGARACLEAVVKEGKSVCDGLRLNWAGEEDEFTAWCAKWKEAVDAPSEAAP